MRQPISYLLDQAEDCLDVFFVPANLGFLVAFMFHNLRRRFKHIILFCALWIATRGELIRLDRKRLNQWLGE